MCDITRLHVQIEGKTSLHKITLASMRSGKAKLELISAAAPEGDAQQDEAPTTGESKD